MSEKLGEVSVFISLPRGGNLYRSVDTRAHEAMHEWISPIDEPYPPLNESNPACVGEVVDVGLELPVYGGPLRFGAAEVWVLNGRPVDELADLLLELGEIAASIVVEVVNRQGAMAVDGLKYPHIPVGDLDEALPWLGRSEAQSSAKCVEHTEWIGISGGSVMARHEPYVHLGAVAGRYAHVFHNIIARMCRRRMAWAPA